MMPTDQPPQESQHGPRASRTWSITVPSAIRLLVIASMVAASLVALLTVDTSTALGGTITNVKATDVRDTSFVVSWTSATAEVGSVAYGVAVSGSCTNATLGSVAQDKRGAAYASQVHYVPISNIDPNLGKTICYRVTSGATQDAAQLVTLGSTTAMVAPDTIYGVVMNGTQPVTDAIAYFTITEGSVTSAPFSAAITSTDGGYYQVSLSGARSADGTLVFGYSDAGSLALTVVAGPGSPTSFQTTVGAARAASCPGCPGLPAITLTGTGATAPPTASATATLGPTATATSVPTNLGPIFPKSVWAGGGPKAAVAIIGTGFVAGSTTSTTVTFNGRPGTVTKVTATQIDVQAPSDPTFGDTTGDGKVQALDALCVLRDAVLLPATSNCKATTLRVPVSVVVTSGGVTTTVSTQTNATFTYNHADLNGDGKVQALDALCVLRRAVSLPATTNCPDPQNTTTAFGAMSFLRSVGRTT